MFVHGVDLIEVSRVKRMLDEHGDSFLSRCFTDTEQSVSKVSSDETRNHRYAARFAAKEAVRKATSTPENSSKLTFKSIEIFNYDSGKPGVDLKNNSVVDISISHDGNYAVAFCVVQ